MSNSHIYIVLFAQNETGEPERITVSSFYDKDVNPNLDAWKIVNESISFEPFNFQLHFERAALAFEKSMYRQAIGFFDYAIKINPQSLEAYYFRGICHAEEKEYELAFVDFLKTIELNPQYYNGYINLGSIKEVQNDLQSALEYYAQAISIDPTIFFGYLKRCEVHKKLKNYKDALKDINTVLSLKSNQRTAMRIKKDILSMLNGKLDK